jgi:hypothetical protein
MALKLAGVTSAMASALVRVSPSIYQTSVLLVLITAKGLWLLAHAPLAKSIPA